MLFNQLLLKLKYYLCLFLNRVHEFLHVFLNNINLVIVNILKHLINFNLKRHRIRNISLLAHDSLYITINLVDINQLFLLKIGEIFDALLIVLPCKLIYFHDLKLIITVLIQVFLSRFEHGDEGLGYECLLELALFDDFEILCHAYINWSFVI